MLVDTNGCVITLGLPIPGIMAPIFVSLMTLSMFEFFPTFIFSLTFYWDLPCPHFQYGTWLRAVPSVMFICAFKPLPLPVTSQINLLVTLL